MPTPPEFRYIPDVGNGQRSELLDVVRAIAICLVVGRHGYISQLSLFGESNHWPTWLANLASNGWLGVDIFFVLSGFLLSRQLLKIQSRHALLEHLASFWARRARRILPSYFLILIPIWLLYKYESNSGIGYKELLIHALFLQDYFGSKLLITTWSLATEEKFYLLLPFLVLASRSIPHLKFATSLFFVALVILAGRLAYSLLATPVTYSEFFWGIRAPFHHAIDGLLLGVAAGYVSHTNPARLTDIDRRKTTGILCALSLAALSILIFVDWLKFSFSASSLVIWAISLITACILLMAVRLEQLGCKKWRMAALTKWISAISYPLYLVHYLTLGSASSIARTTAAAHAGLSPELIFWTVYIGASVGIAWLIHRFVEKPFLKARESRPTPRLDTNENAAS